VIKHKMAKDNYEEDKDARSPCENCVHKYNFEKCKTCKHRKEGVARIKWW